MCIAFPDFLICINVRALSVVVQCYMKFLHSLETPFISPHLLHWDGSFHTLITHLRFFCHNLHSFLESPTSQFWNLSTFRFILCILISVNFNMCIMSCIQDGRNITNRFFAQNISHASCMNPSPCCLQPLAPAVISLVNVFAFWECHSVGFLRHTAFSDWLLSWAIDA